MLKVAVIVVVIGTRVAPSTGDVAVIAGGVAAGTTTGGTTGVTAAEPGSVQEPPPPPPQPDRILTKTPIITIQTRYAFCDLTLFIHPPFK